ncbi:MAG: PIN domain-containing protein, partial [Alphaproteobacteria bacterium]|nr:PIN domain-containing protein [Alphaproteobacteria bacterium]
RRGEVSLIVPCVVVDEVSRNKARIIEESNRSLSGSLKRVKEAVDKYGDPRGKRAALRLLNDVDHRLPALGEAAAESIARVEELFKAAAVIETSAEVKLRAAQRAIDGRAPFHRQRNSIHDAILIENYADFANAKRTAGIRFAFVTHNTKDFSHVGVNNKLPHPDIAAYFSRVKSLYFTTLGEALRRVQPELLSDLIIEQEWVEEPRRFTEIIAAIDELYDKVWYNRHMNWREKIEAGKIKIVEKETFPIRDHSTRPIQRDVWEGALKAAARKEREYGAENLGPWDDFEWGMLNGKLSALRWVLGDEWDMLDT